MTPTLRRFSFATTPWRHRLMLALGCMTALCVGLLQPALAQSNPSGSSPLRDPPGRVARLADFSGQIWLHTPDTGEWSSAARNRPLTTGDRLATDPGARADLQIGSTTLRLDSSTELEILRLDDDHVALQLHAGSVAARLHNPAEVRQFDLTTDEGRFTIQRAGRYRFDRASAASVLSVDTGQALYEGASSALTLYSGQRAEFWIDANRAAQYSITEPARDAFTAWNNERDRAADRQVVRYVSPEMTGAEDLDRYGRWENNPDYGSLWIPRGVATDWAPYSTGHWAWVQPWGWTWVDDAPWGFAPFHYGRWVYVRNTWGWSPGALVARPVYAPALVGWLGGPGVSVSVTIGAGPAVGWFPLAPREVYVPSYRASPRYAQNINITNVTNITNITTVINNPRAPREFDNRRYPNAVTVVPATVLTDRRPVAPAAAQWRDAPWVREFAARPGPAVALVAPPVGAPWSAPRVGDPRPVRPPPVSGATPARRFEPPANAPAGWERAQTMPPVAPAALPRPATPSGLMGPREGQDSPVMRRGDERRGDDRREPARNESLPPAPVRVAPQAADPAGVPPRPVAVPRPPQVRPAEGGPPPQVKPPERLRAPAELPKNAGEPREERREERRGEPRREN